MVDQVNECEQSGNIHKEKRGQTQSDGSGSDKFITQNDTATKTIDGSYSLLTKLDKAVSTNDAFLDLERALTYEAVFNTLIENKMLAMKRECEERKRSSRLKRSSIGRIFLNRKIFGATSRKGDSKTSSQDSPDKPPHEERIPVTPERVHTETPFKTTCEEIEAVSTTSTDSNSVRAALPKAKPHAAVAAVNSDCLPNAEDSVTSTVSHSSTKRNVLVRAQTHTPADLSGSASGVENEENGVRTYTEISRPAHTSTLAEGSLTSLRDSLESLSFANSSSLVLEGEPERLIKRMRLLEARSISAQCSPILPRKPAGPTKGSVASVATPLPTTNRNIHVNASRATERTAADASSSVQRSVSAAQQFRRSAINEDYAAPLDDVDGNPAHARFFSRQNTSEDSANLTVSTLLNQSDSQSLHVSPSYANAPTVAAAGTMIALNGRLKSRSTSLLVNRRSRVLLTPINNNVSRTPESNGMPVDSIENNTPNVSGNTSRNDNRLVAAFADNSRNQLTDQIRKTDTITPSTLNGLSSKPAIQHSYTANDAIITITSSDGRESKSIMQLHRIASTSTGSSIAPTGCCTTAKSATREKEKKSFKPSVTSGQSGSDDDRHHKRKYRRYHRCSDPALVYPTPSTFQHCVLNIVSDDPVKYSLNENFTYDSRIMHKADDLEQIIPKIHRHHHKPRHHHHKKRHRHNRKGKILVQDLETQVVKVIDPHDLSQRARWTIIATACLLLLMCLLLVGITLRMAPIIDDMVRLENDRIKETLDRARYSKNMTDSASLVASTHTQQIP